MLKIYFSRASLLKLALKITLPLVFTAIVFAVFFTLIHSPDTSSISVRNSHIEMTVNQNFNAYTTCGISYNSVEEEKPTFSCSNTEVLKIGSTSGQAQCLSVGEATIVVKLKVDDGEYIEKEIEVEVSEQVIYTQEMSIAFSEVILYGKDDCVINTLTLGKTTLTPVVWSENGYAKYDYISGKVTSTKNDRVYIQINKSETEKITLHFDVIVEEVETSQINITLKVNQTKKVTLPFTTDDRENVLTQTPQVLDSSIASVLEPYNADYLFIQAHKVGNTTILVICEGKQIVINVTVVE